MNDNASRAKCQAGGGPLERRVRPHSALGAYKCENYSNTWEYVSP